jgi:membrane dipeptidase
MGSVMPAGQGAEARRLHSSQVVIDAHSDILIDVADGYCRLGEKFQPSGGTSRCVRGQVDLPRLLEGGVDAQVLAIFVGEDHRNAPLRRALAMIDACYREEKINRDRMVIATSADDVLRAKREGKVATLLALEGAEPLGTDLAVLRVMYKLGVRIVGLTWNWRNMAADGWDASSCPGGLTPFGLAVVEEMGRLGMILDIAHLAKPGFWQALEATRYPIIGSHCITEGQYHSLDDDQLRAVAANGGVICAMGVFKDDLSAVVEQIEHIARVAGIDHVGFGADYYGLDAAPKDLEDVTKYPALTEALLAAGFDSRDVAKIMGGNLLRVFGEVLRP